MANRDRARDIAKDVAKDAALGAARGVGRLGLLALREATGVGTVKRKWEKSATADRVESVQDRRYRHGQCVCGKPAPGRGQVHGRCATRAAAGMVGREERKAQIAQLEKLRSKASGSEARQIAAELRELRKG